MPLPHCGHGAVHPPYPKETIVSDEPAETGANPGAGSKHRTVTLDYDVEQAGKVVIAAGTDIIVSKPLGGALRGTNIGGLMRGDYDEVASVIPRITNPALQPAAMDIDPADIAQIAGVITDFLLSRATKAVLYQGM